jgi:hypothetical protein
MSITFEELHVAMCKSITERNKTQPMTEEEKTEWAKEFEKIVDKIDESHFKDD